MNHRSKNFDFTSDGSIRGYASVFHIKDFHKEIILPGAFNESVAGFSSNKPVPKMLFEHQQDIEVGQWHVIEEDLHGLWVEGQVFSKTDVGRHMLDLLKCGQVTGLSIGFIPLKTFTKNSIKTIATLKLFEISLVFNPANPLAAIGSLGSLGSLTQ